MKLLHPSERTAYARGERFQTIVADAERHIPLDVLPTRKKADLIRYFLQFSREERRKVEFVVMDMSSLFRRVAKSCFPNAKIIADRYHVVRQAQLLLHLRIAKERILAHTLSRWFCCVEPPQLLT